MKFRSVRERERAAHQGNLTGLSVPERQVRSAVDEDAAVEILPCGGARVHENVDIMAREPLASGHLEVERRRLSCVHAAWEAERIDAQHVDGRWDRGARAPKPVRVIDAPIDRAVDADDPYTLCPLLTHRHRAEGA